MSPGFLVVFCFMAPARQSCILFPYTTLFRSEPGQKGAVMADQGKGCARAGQMLLQPFDCLDVEMVCRRSEEHTSELQSRGQLVCRLLLLKKRHHECYRHFM